MLKKLFSKITKGESGSPSIPDLIFNDSVSAFEYACKYGNTKIEKDIPMIAIVMAGPSGQPVLLMDSGIQKAMLRVASHDGGFTVVAESLTANGPKLQVGDLVSWVPAMYVLEIADQLDDKRFAWMGYVLGTVNPKMSSKGWQWKSRFTK